jgi:hypothetical protein
MLRCISISLILFPCFIVFNSCKKQNDCDCLKPRGETVTDIRSVAGFTTLQTFDKVDVYYIQDTSAGSCTVKVVTGKNLISNISTEVSDGVLQIKNDNKCNFVRGSHNDVTVYVTAPHITYFIQDGVGTTYSGNTIVEDSVRYNIRNSGDIHLDVAVKQTVTGSLFGIGDIYLTGTAQKHLVNATGECFINAKDLQTAYCFIVYNSSGQAFVNVSGELDAVVSYLGDIYYSGNPSVIHKNGTGKGELIKN